MNGRARVFLLLRPANALKHLPEYGQVGTDGFGNFVEEATGVYTANVRLSRDLLFGEPIVDRPVLGFGRELIGVAEVDVSQLRSHVRRR
jgi:hypothetical protein